MNKTLSERVKKTAENQEIEQPPSWIIMLYVLTYAIAFLLPGFFLVRIFKPRRNAFLLSFALSYTLLVINLSLARVLRIPCTRFGGLVLMETVLLGIWLAMFEFGRDSVRLRIRFSTRLRRRVHLFPVILIVAAVWGYLYVVGPYMEVPADCWSHLGRTVEQFSLVEKRAPPAGIPLKDMMTFQGDYWYFVQAFLCGISGMSPGSAVFLESACNTTLLCLGLYFFALLLFRHIRRGRLFKSLVAMTSVVFFVLTVGISVFAYVRYYTLAPAFLNYLMYLSLVAVFMELISSKGSWWNLLLFCIIGHAAFMIHSQEAMFAAAMVFAVIVAAFFCQRFRKPCSPFARNRVSVFFAASVVLYIALFAWIHLHREVGTGDSWPFVPPYFELKRLCPLAGNMLILDPSRQFLQAILPWGVFVCGVFLLRFGRYGRNPYVLGGMLLPFLTMFNPLTVDMLSRLNYASCMYRFCYILPLPFIAGREFWESLRGLVCDPGILKKTACLLVLAGLVLLLVPFDLAGNLFARTHLPTLAPVPEQNGQQVWNDLVQFSDTLSDRRIISDPVTAYVVGQSTRNTGMSYKFERPTVSLHLEYPDRTELVFRDLDLDANYVLIVNTRDGGMSPNGRISGHWPEDVLKIASRFDPGLRELVSKHGEFFNKLWESDGVAVYDILEDEIRNSASRVPVLMEARAVILEGPGIRVDWSDVDPEGFVAYHVQCSIDGETWVDISTNREHVYSWIHHQGAPDDVCGEYSYCLPSGSRYFYRVRAVYEDGPGEWSNVMEGRVMDYTRQP